jgi:hypothetical protein
VAGVLTLLAAAVGLAHQTATAADADAAPPTAGKASAAPEVTSASVDLSPIFTQRGLAVRCQGDRGTCSVMTYEYVRAYMNDAVWIEPGDATHNAE